MTKSDIKDYLIKSLTFRSRTSYKYYLLLSLLDICNKKDTISLIECGINMIVLSWNDLSDPKNKYPDLDKLNKYKISLMKRLSLPEYLDEKEIKMALNVYDDQLVFKIAYEITRYCPYLFLSIGQWDSKLKNTENYHERHRLIQELSQQESYLYEIYDDKIILNSEYFDVIRKNITEFNYLVRSELKNFLRK